MKLIEWLMLGLKILFQKRKLDVPKPIPTKIRQPRIKPRLMDERVAFKQDFYLYVVKYFLGHQEMWAESLYDGGHKHVFLGKIIEGEWIKPKNFRLLKHNMQGGYDGTLGAPKLFKMYKKGFDTPTKKGNNKRMKEVKKVYTREDFVKFGKMGQDKVRAKYKKNSVTLRWAKHKKTLKSKSKELSTREVLQRFQGGI